MLFGIGLQGGLFPLIQTHFGEVRSPSCDPRLQHINTGGWETPRTHKILGGCFVAALCLVFLSRLVDLDVDIARLLLPLVFLVVLCSG